MRRAKSLSPRECVSTDGHERREHMAEGTGQFSAVAAFLLKGPLLANCIEQYL